MVFASPSALDGRFCAPGYLKSSKAPVQGSGCTGAILIRILMLNDNTNDSTNHNTNENTNENTNNTNKNTNDDTNHLP